MDVDNDMTYTPLHRDKTEERKNNDYLHKFRHKLDQIRNLSYDLDATMIQTLRDNGSGQEMLDKLDAMQRDIHAMFPEVSGLRRVLKPSVANHPDYVPSNSNSNRNQPLRRSKTTLGDAGLDSNSNSNNKKPRYL
eukprot:597723_1